MIYLTYSDFLVQEVYKFLNVFKYYINKISTYLVYMKILVDIVHDLTLKNMFNKTWLMANGFYVNPYYLMYVLIHFLVLNKYTIPFNKPPHTTYITHSY